MRTEEQIMAKRDFKIRELEELKKTKKEVLSQSTPEQSSNVDFLFEAIFEKIQTEIDIYNWVLIDTVKAHNN
jgi:ribosomal protein S25